MSRSVLLVSETCTSKKVGAVQGEDLLLTGTRNTVQVGRRDPPRDGVVCGFFRKVKSSSLGYRCTVRSEKRMLMCTGQKRACGTGKLPGCSSSSCPGSA